MGIGRGSVKLVYTQITYNYINTSKYVYVLCIVFFLLIHFRTECKRHGMQWEFMIGRWSYIYFCFRLNMFHSYVYVYVYVLYATICVTVSVTHIS